MSDYLVWIDCEMTGLDLRTDALIEVALLMTDAELNVVGDGVDLVIKPPQEALDTMPDVVRAMHTTSGLLDELGAGITLAEAEEQLLLAVRQYVPEVRKAPLCGNSIATDRGFIARDLPVLDDHLHYRMIDVSSIKELARRWYPRVYFASPAKSYVIKANPKLEILAVNDLNDGPAYTTPAISGGNQHAETWFPPAGIGTRSGWSSMHISMAKGQRGWKPHPVGTLMRLGGEPMIGVSRPPTTPVADGTEPSRPRV